MDLTVIAFVLFFGTYDCVYTPPKPVESDLLGDEKSGDISSTLGVYGGGESTRTSNCRVKIFASRENLDDYLEQNKIDDGWIFTKLDGSLSPISVKQKEKADFKSEVRE